MQAGAREVHCENTCPNPGREKTKIGSSSAPQFFAKRGTAMSDEESGETKKPRADVNRVRLALDIGSRLNEAAWLIRQ
jgi:hypothetical protein